MLLVFLGFLFVVFCLFASHVHRDLTRLAAVGHRQHAVPHTFCNITTVTGFMARTASDPKKRSKGSLETNMWESASENTSSKPKCERIFV